MTPRALARARRLAALHRDLLVSVRRAQRDEPSAGREQVTTGRQGKRCVRQRPETNP